MKGSDRSGVLTIMVGHKEYVLSPLCVLEESDELIDSKANKLLGVNLQQL
jgi:hypothetical protein